jgi:hypothetical protein
LKQIRIKESSSIPGVWKKSEIKDPTWSCLDLSAFTIGGRSRRNVRRTGGCRGPVSPRAHFLSHFHCCVLFALRCGVLQLLHAPASLRNCPLPWATPSAGRRPVCLSWLQFFFFFFFPASFDAKIVLIGSEYSTQLPGQEEISACTDHVLLLEQLIGPEPSLCVRASSSSLSVNFSFVFLPTYGASFCVELLFRFCQFFLSMRN